MSDHKDRPHCYLDHANKRSENYAANPYLFWLNQVRRKRAEEQAARLREDERETRSAQS
jgi:hypothetical protein